MKKHTVRNVILLVLAAALLIGACLFFFVFRKDLTASVLIYGGDRFEQSGRYNRTIAFYRQAQKLQPEDETIPRRLAKAYILSGNYTKAEYTLVSAITRDPESVELYAELSRTYVAQDKLMDAEQMLGSIANESVKAAIEALRPATPVLTPESGYYSEYIDVSAYSASGSVYLTATTDFPSLATDLYTGPVTLPGGESTVIAISVDANGLVSRAAYAGYTVGNVVEAVTFEDSAVDAAVREQLGKAASDEIMSDELWEIEEFTVPEETQSLSDLRFFTGLQTLTIHNAPSTLDLSIIGTLTTLRTLDLTGCTLSQSMLETVGTLPDLTSLTLSNCAIESINPLVGLTKLKMLDLTNNTISDITAVSSMTELRELHLTNNPISSITYLNNCLLLEKLYVENCGISKLSSLAGNTNLSELYASNNEISDISVLADCTALSVIDLSENKLSDISVLTNFPELVNFKANNNQIKAVPKFDPETSKLVQFSANYNEIEDVSGFAKLLYLNYIRVDYNKVKDISCLKDCYNIIQIDVWDNPVDTKSIPDLQEIGIIVNYNPTYEPPKEAA